MPSETAKRNSPCISVCENDDAHGVCIGCYRTPEEIAMWKLITEEEQERILVQLPLRRKEILKSLWGDKIKAEYTLV